MECPCSLIFSLTALVWLLLLAGAGTHATSCPSLPLLVASDMAKVFTLYAAKFNSTTQSLAYNNSAVGPLIRVNVGDLVQVDVTNVDIPQGTSVHWHGQELRNASWADGAQGISQYPIRAGGTFSYRFTAQPAGTFWYHSHTDTQFGDGLRGPLVVVDPNDPQKMLYDQDLDEHILMLADVFDSTVEEQLMMLRKYGMSMNMQCTALAQDFSDAPWYGAQVNGKGFIGTGNATTGKPYVISVKKGQRYRLRVVGGMSSWSLKMEFEKHKFDIIALDGAAIQPVSASSLVISSGERMDIVLNANEAVGNYWVNVGTLSGKNSPAILHYEGASNPLEDAAFLASVKRELGCNYGAAGQNDSRNATFVSLTSNQAPPQTANKQFTMYLSNSVSTVASAIMVQQVNNKSTSVYGNISLPASSIAACPDESNYCWSLNWNVWSGSGVPFIFYNESKPTNRTFNIDLVVGDVVDLVLVNPTMMVHPMHLHGIRFWVLATSNGDVLDAAGEFMPSKATGFNVINPPMRDTIPVAQATMDMGNMGHMDMGMGNMGPMGNGTVQNGYAVIRFKAENPGVWAFHCHIDLHMGSGMFMTFSVKQQGSSAPWYVPDNLSCTSNPTSSTPTASATMSMAMSTSVAPSMGMTTTTGRPNGDGKIGAKRWQLGMVGIAILLVSVL